jgi:hypothetical protein
VKIVIATGLALLALTIVPQRAAIAVERLSAAELASHCDYFRTSPDSTDGIFCVRYIQGFIDGAIATDERVTLNVADEYDREESFSERAIRIRVGHRLANFGSYYAEFCLGEPVPLAEVVDKVVGGLEQAKPVSSTRHARDIVYMTLREHYPCEADDKSDS